MATIRGAVSQVDQDVGATSRGAFVEPMRSDGTPLTPLYAGVYSLRFEVVPTTLTAALAYWTMRNTGSRRVIVRSTSITNGFSGTAAASRSLYEMGRFGSATPTGGTSLTPIQHDNTYPASSVLDARFSPSGLTTTGVVFEAPFALFGVPNQLNAVTTREWNPISEQDAFTLAVGEGLYIRSNTAIVLGSYLVGSIKWSERT